MLMYNMPFGAGVWILLASAPKIESILGAEVFLMLIPLSGLSRIDRREKGVTYGEAGC